MTPKWLKKKGAKPMPKRPGMKKPSVKPMKGSHCHDNGVCHDHPDDGKDYG